MLSLARLFATPWTLQSMEFSRPGYWSGLHFPSPRDLPNPGFEPNSPALQADSLPAESLGKPIKLEIQTRMKTISHNFSKIGKEQRIENCISSIQSLGRVRLCDPMNRSTPGLPVHHQLLEFTQTHVHRVGDAIQPSDPLSYPSPPAPNPSQH